MTKEAFPTTADNSIKNEQSSAEQREIQTKDVFVGDIELSAKVKIDSDGKIEFIEDIYQEDGMGSYDDCVQPLIDAGILTKESLFSKNKSGFELMSDAFGGWIHLLAKDLNRAITEGKLEVSVDQDGDIVLG